jgi:tRNAThr (cytosine32-N3)-methyltransferase
MNACVGRAWAAIDDVHRADTRTEAGLASELRYADRLEGWVRRLVTAPSDALLLAARAQHLERWAIPRDTYPAGRGGYLRWRSDVHRRQGERARQILAEAGCEEALAARVGALVGKAAPRGDAEAQALEDAACLLFLETDFLDFIREYPHDKIVDVVRKTWKKMSPVGHAEAGKLALPAEAAAIVGEAVGGG